MDLRAVGKVMLEHQLGRVNASGGGIATADPHVVTRHGG